MELMPTVCPKCGDVMSTPIPGRRTGLLISTCRNGQCLYTERSATPVVAKSFTPVAPVTNHSRMVVPVTPTLPRAAVQSAFERFEEAQLEGTTRKVIATAKREADRAKAIDPKVKQLGAFDR